MAERFVAEMVTRSELDQTRSRLEISFCDARGQSQTLSIGPEAVAGLAAILAELGDLRADARERVTKMPKRYAVGCGRHEPFVMLRFEDEPAYGLTAEQATNLADALLEEAEAISDVKFLMRQ